MAKRSTKKVERLHPIGEKLTAIERPDNIKRMIWGLAGFCALLVLINLVVHIHGHFPIEEIPGFYAAYGFIAFAFIIISTKYLRKMIGRREDYYAPGVVDPEDYPKDQTDIAEHGDV